MIRCLLLAFMIFLTNNSFGQTPVKKDSTAKRNILMKEITVKPKTYDYKQDSANNRIIYSKAFNTSRDNVRVRLNNEHDPPGLIVRGVIGQLAYAISGKKRKANKFIGDIVANESAHITDSRYTPELASRVTHLTGDTLAHFMNRYPVTVDFVENASDLEFMMWIRTNYNDWVAHGRPIPSIKADTIIYKQAR